MVSTLKESKHRINWKDTDKNIYDEDSSKVFEIRFFGIRVWGNRDIVDTKHVISDKSKSTVGFSVSDNDKGRKQTR